MKKFFIFTIILFSFQVQAGRYDHLLNGNASIEDLCAALTGAMGDRSSGASLDAVMDYFVAGIYLNARWIEKGGFGSAIEKFILERAHQELNDEKFKQMSQTMDHVIAQANPTTTAITVWRGQAPNVPPPRNGKMYEVGESIVFPQYLSTSNQKSLAESYAKRVLMKILVPHGVRALNVQNYLGMPSQQYELVFGRDMRLDIEKVEVRGQRTYVEALMVPQRGSP